MIDIYSQYLAELSKQLTKMRNLITQLNSRHDSEESENSREKILRLEKMCEDICVTGRRMLRITLGEEYVEGSILESVPCEIELTEDNWFRIRIPMLPQKKSKSSDVSYIRESLYCLMDDYFRHHERIRLGRSTIVFNHIYSDKTPEKQWHDHDNIEVKAITDVIALYLLPDDNPHFLNRFQTSSRGSENCTEIWLIPQGELGTWLEKNSEHQTGTQA